MNNNQGGMWDNAGNLTLNVYECEAAPTTVQVHIFKYLNNVQATAANAKSVAFPMVSTWTAANLNSGNQTSGSYDLGTDDSYQAATSPMDTGATYSTNESTGGSVVGVSCTTGQPYVLVGYTIGATLADAAAATPTLTVPSFANLASDEYVIVWNKTCPPPKTLKVHILKYLDGHLATAYNVPGKYQFPMTSTWQAANLNGGVRSTGNYVLGDNYGSSKYLYGANTSLMDAPANYTTSEITGTSKVLPIGASCVTGDYRLLGYTSGPSFNAAANKKYSTTAPSFTGMTKDEYVIVWNETCKPAPKDKDQCKDDGWKNFSHLDNSPFKNQGDCVSFFASNGKSGGNH